MCMTANSRLIRVALLLFTFSALFTVIEASNFGGFNFGYNSFYQPAFTSTSPRVSGNKREHVNISDDDDEQEDFSGSKRSKPMFSTTLSSLETTPFTMAREISLPSSQTSHGSGYRTPVHEGIHVVSAPSSLERPTNYTSTQTTSASDDESIQPIRFINSLPFSGLVTGEQGKVSLSRAGISERFLLNSIDSEIASFNSRNPFEIPLRKDETDGHNRPESVSAALTDQLASFKLFSHPSKSRILSMVDERDSFPTVIDLNTSPNSGSMLDDESEDDFLEFEANLENILEEILRESPDLTLTETTSVESESESESEGEGESESEGEGEGESKDYDGEFPVSMKSLKYDPKVILHSEAAKIMEEKFNQLDLIRKEELDAKESILSDSSLSQIRKWEAEINVGVFPDFESFNEFIPLEDASSFLKSLLNKQFNDSGFYADILHSFLFDFYFPRQWDVQLLVALKAGQRTVDKSINLYKLLMHTAQRSAESMPIYRLFYKFAVQDDLLDTRNAQELAWEFFHANQSKDTRACIRQLLDKALADGLGKQVGKEVRQLFVNFRNVFKLLISKHAPQSTFEAAIIHFAPFLSDSDIDFIFEYILYASEPIRSIKNESEVRPGPEPKKPAELLSNEAIEALPLSSKERFEAQLIGYNYDKAIEEYQLRLSLYSKYKYAKLRFECLLLHYAAFVKHFPECLNRSKAALESYHLSAHYCPLLVFQDYVFFGRIYVALLMKPSPFEFDIENFAYSLSARPLLPADAIKNCAQLHFFIALDRFLKWSRFLADVNDTKVFEAKNALFNLILANAELSFVDIVKLCIEQNLSVALEAALIFGKLDLDLITDKSKFIAQMFSITSPYLRTEMACMILAHIPVNFQAFLTEIYGVASKSSNPHFIFVCKSVIEVACILQFAQENVDGNVYQFTLPREFFELRPKFLSASDSPYMLWAVRGIIWRAWKIPFAMTSISHPHMEGTSLREAFQWGNAILAQFGKEFSNDFSDIDVVPPPKKDDSDDSSTSEIRSPRPPKKNK